jgi:hypothetical protein
MSDRYDLREFANDGEWDVLAEQADLDRKREREQELEAREAVRPLSSVRVIRKDTATGGNQ